MGTKELMLPTLISASTSAQDGVVGADFSQSKRQWVQGLEVRQTEYGSEEVQRIQGTLSLRACISLHTENQDYSGEAESFCQIAFGEILISI